jgi:hypothetical protein
MSWKQKDDQKLKDVKAALRVLQRIDVDASAPIEPQQPEHDAKGGPAQGKRLGALALALIALGTVIVLAIDLFFKYSPALLPGKQADQAGSKAIPPAAGADQTSSKASPPAAGNAGTGLSAAETPVKTAQPAKLPAAGESAAAPPVSTTPDPRINPILENARQLMDAGKIAAARKLLLQPSLAASQDAAWLIARSFDPNYLATLQSPDAKADKVQAEEWYRRWRDIGARNGAGMDDARLKRLIDAMQ